MRKRSDLVGVVSLVGALALAGAGCDRANSSSSSAGSTSGGSGAATSPAVPEASVPAQERVAVVNAVPITVTDVELAVDDLKRLVQAYQQTWKPLSTENVPDGLDLGDVASNIIDAELKAQDVRARGLDRKTDFRRKLAFLERSVYAQEWDRWQRDRSTPTEEQSHQFYEQNKTGFVDPERLHARQIVMDTLADAEAVRAQAVQGTPFAQLAKERSVGAGKDSGGDVGWHLRAVDRERLTMLGAAPSESIFFPQLEPVAFALEAGQVSQPVKGPDEKFYLVTVEERKPSRQQTEVEVHDAVKGLLTLQNMQKAFQELRKPDKAKIEVFAERLKDVKQ